MQLWKSNYQFFEFCGRFRSFYHVRSDVDSWAAAVGQIRPGDYIQDWPTLTGNPAKAF